MYPYMPVRCRVVRFSIYITLYIWQVVYSLLLSGSCLARLVA
jgi:hypothetical protein